LLSTLGAPHAPRGKAPLERRHIGAAPRRRAGTSHSSGGDGCGWWGIILIGSGSDEKRHARALHHHLGGGRPTCPTRETRIRAGGVCVERELASFIAAHSACRGQTAR